MSNDVSATENVSVDNNPVVEVNESTLPNGHLQDGQASVTVEDKTVNGGIGAVEDGVAKMGLESSQTLMQGDNSELHRACAEGRLDDVRECLGKGVESLETLDINTGCTPIVLAIRAGHHDIVRELLQAGAIVPPPGLTGDPHMLSLLYPQATYGLPPYMSAPPPEFYSQPFYPPGAQPGMPPHQQQQRYSPNGNGAPRRESPPTLGGGPGNLPPMDVAKTIPCRNFPNCKYGANCVFYHPIQQGYYPGPGGPNGYIPGYEYGYPPQQPPFVPGPNGSQGYPPQPPQSQLQQENGETTNDSTPTSADTPPSTQIETPNTTSFNNTNGPASGLSVFVPSFQPGNNSHAPLGSAPLSSPPPHPSFGMMSPNSMMSASLPSLPPPESFYATSPPPGATFGSQPGTGHIRRQSFNNNPNSFNNNKPFGHAKKPSFSGVGGIPRPFGAGPGPRASIPGGAAAPNFGSWKDGNPPPCAFFNQGKCRNGEFCKFPHLDTEGNDVRHPDVIRGIIPPVPSLARQARGPMRMGMGGMGGMGGIPQPQNFGPYDPNFRQQQQQSFIQGRQQAASATAAAAVQGEATTTATSNGIEASLSTDTTAATESTAPTSTEITTSSSQDKPASIPENAPAETAASTPSNQVSPNPDITATLSAPVTPAVAIARSASQPGVPRVHMNGHPNAHSNSRSHSPAPSNVSFHGNGHPRRPARMNGPGPFGSHNNNINNNNNNMPRQGGRSTSADFSSTQQAQSRFQQRVPGKDEFPALGGLNGNGNSSPKEGVTSSTSASGLKTAAQVLSAPAPYRPAAAKRTSVDETSKSVEEDKSDKESVTMESESDSDAVIISTNAPSSAKNPSPEKAPLSFASIASSVAPATAATIDSNAVGVKA